MKISLSQLAQQFNLDFIGDPNKIVHGVSTLEKANNDQLSFLSNPKYGSKLDQTQAGIVIVPENKSENYNGNKLIASDSYLAYAKIATLFQEDKSHNSGVHETAILEEGVIIEENVSIGAFTIIGKNTKIKSGTQIDSHVHIGYNCKIGAYCKIKSQSVISYECRLGDRVIVHQGAVIGADGFGLARDNSTWIKVPQLGAVQIGNDCEIGANTTVDRGTLDDTILEDDVRLDNQIQIAHNVIIGEHTVMAGCSAVAGSAKIGKNCLIGGGVGIIGHLEICDGVTLQSMALVTHSIKKPGSYSSVSPIQETSKWRKSAVRIKQLDKLAKSIAKIEKSHGDLIK